MDGSGGFWIFIAALVVGGMWSDSRKKAEKHETLRTIIEKTGTIDEAKLRALFSDDAPETKPGYAYRGLRIGGTIVMFVGAGIGTALLVAATLGKIFGAMAMFKEIEALFVGLAIAIGIAVLGWGMFYSARFATPPPGAGNEPPAR